MNLLLSKDGGVSLGGLSLSRLSHSKSVHLSVETLSRSHMSHTELGTLFQREIYADFIPDSGLVILGEGLGIFQLIKAFVDLYADPKTLVFLLGATPRQEGELMNMFTGGGVAN